MRQSYLRTFEDMDWLRSVHGIDTTGIVCAIVEGNEDAPERILLYAEDRSDAVPLIWTPPAD